MLGLGLCLTSPALLGGGAATGLPTLPAGYAFLTYNGDYVTYNGDYVIVEIA